MKISQSFFLILICSVLTACGGGSGSSSTSGSAVSAPENEGKELVFEFANAPLEPSVSNILAGTGDPENHFAPNETIAIFWKLDIYYDETSAPEFGETFPYTAAVYQSEDGIYQEEEDLELFSISCMWPSDPDYACGIWASFQCDYAPGNQNVISCTSIPLDTPNGITDHTIDTSVFLDVIPKTAEVLYVACMDEEPYKCATFKAPLQLN